jgi:hypothetical protein
MIRSLNPSNSTGLKVTNSRPLKINNRYFNYPGSGIIKRIESDALKKNRNFNVTEFSNIKT